MSVYCKDCMYHFFENGKLKGFIKTGFLPLAYYEKVLKCKKLKKIAKDNVNGEFFIYGDVVKDHLNDHFMCKHFNHITNKLKKKSFLSILLNKIKGVLYV